jgi:hypothetical protein
MKFETAFTENLEVFWMKFISNELFSVERQWYTEGCTAETSLGNESKHFLFQMHCMNICIATVTMKASKMKGCLLMGFLG